MSGGPGKPIFGGFLYMPFWAEVFQAIKEKGHCETYRIFYATKLTPTDSAGIDVFISIIPTPQN